VRKEKEITGGQLGSTSFGARTLGKFLPVLALPGVARLLAESPCSTAGVTTELT
jgi:hypothetical protein